MARRKKVNIDWEKYLPLGLLLLAVPLLSFAKGGGSTPQLPVLPNPNGSGGNNTGGNPKTNLPAPGTPNSYKCSISRGIRNNNPGNLLNGSYVGVVANNTDYDCASGKVVRKYAQFETIEYGILAIIKILMNNLQFGFFVTPNDVLKKYPNATTGAYITAVSQIMGVSPLQAIIWNEQMIEKAVKAIAKIETGQNAVSSEQFEFAWTVLFKK